MGLEKLINRRTIVFGVILIIGMGVVSCVFGLVYFYKTINDARREDTHVFSNLADIAVALEGYKGDNNNYPENISQLVPAYLDSIPTTPYTMEEDDYPQSWSDVPAYNYKRYNKTAYQIRFLLKNYWLPFSGWSYERCEYPSENRWFPANITIDCAASDFHTLEEYF